MTQIYIEVGKCKKVGRALLLAVAAGNTVNRCSSCVYHHANIEKCYAVRCRADERPDMQNVYFERYDTHSYNPQH
jgi:hypothetical protein